jgi:hypothetical protein
MIVATHAGTGKTVCASRYPEKFLYLVSGPYKYEESPDVPLGEAGKAHALIRKACCTHPYYAINSEIA